MVVSCVDILLKDVAESKNKSAEEDRDEDFSSSLVGPLELSRFHEALDLLLIIIAALKLLWLLNLFVEGISLPGFQGLCQHRGII